MSEEPLFDPRNFMISDGITHLCAGGESAPLHRHATALSRYRRDKSRGMVGRVAQEAEIPRARAGIARCWGVDAASIGFVSSVAEGVSIIAESFDWREGDEFVVYASVRHRLARRKSVALADLVHERWTATTASAILGQQSLQRTFEARGLPMPQIALTSDSAAMNHRLVASSDLLGVASNRPFLLLSDRIKGSVATVAAGGCWGSRPSSRAMRASAPTLRSFTTMLVA